ncbi:MAG: Rne/Rng family ribonuclease [Armatimonadia bacterium]|nr:Rne/Rng family ribonuclease [Armatimonadia bacterium]
MNKQVLISVDPRETRLAVLEDGELVQLRIERDPVEVGSIYKGRIERVLPGMDSCFVDIGLDRNAFMHVSDFIEAEEEAKKADEKKQRRRRGSRGRRSGKPRRESLPPITDVAKEGDEILVQVARAPLGNKGARGTTRISLPGHHIVLLPVGSGHVGVSRKIESDSVRGRLKDWAREVKPRGYGMIVRTEASGCTKEDLEADVERLRKTWRRIKDGFRKKKAPALLHEDLSLVQRMVRDMYSDEVKDIILDSESEYQTVKNALRDISKNAAKRCSLYRGDKPLFEAYGIEAELEKSLRRRVPLPSGGNLTIDETEAMTTVDVNTGSFVGSTNLNDTILQTNMESAKEIARQLRIRDIGGIIILDFIDMDVAEHRKKLMDALEKELAKDRARTRIVHLSPLGLIEMTRKRTGQSLLQNLCRTCTACEGRGRVLSAETHAAQLERELRRRVKASKPEAFVVFVDIDVAWELIGDKGEAADKLEESLNAQIYVRVDRFGTGGKPDIYQGKAEDMESEHHAFREGQMYHCRPVQVSSADGGHRLVAETDGYLLLLEGVSKRPDGLITVELTDVHRSFAIAQPI